ncbi:RNA-binding region RNP-1 domain-containing protein [Dictyostelium discoideum AX4]|uniref:Eukaryotic translation initiation factor 3 subunit G n=1 Tax=Dictyostelium discoideum TaxID=44689 RepID=EIF3G_DICDI|nr:RNA-binding region RNP-1 domain-containing protein [Dictyostelium discoideum AX4]Q54WM4.1 RecName: Full=Eukaryotic translation initiation factor 3 subunit G; Short=eIF3g; AltName: Full=Eukaryotic translation initiation factor 3 RNA-binding subunit; Short=eIF-3 RNA-binding subunit; AltName: Full=Eukaryotic translation initiation factor 3 subunit 4 [Dictyostelium discoideum]EAL67713.1 RNA-binding region RNP-1 domain-containing protein [Dictyostelium discoideum AX4]|eukprot:XP_641693.1 RNA-binding region RNP-1 domain-containing protein [Dictyostelium discoideum AX4]
MTSTNIDNRVPIEKTIEVIVKNDKGEEVKVIKRYQEYQITVKRNRKVDERKKWKKFGECDNKTGLENTAYGDEQFLVLTRGAEVKEEEKDVVKCRICKKNHFTTKCPYKDALELTTQPQKSEKEEKPISNKYIAPNLRGGYTGSAPSGSDVPSIMVSNLSQNATEKDLYELFGQFGPVSRVSIPKSMEGSSKGFAYVTYNHLDSAEKALKQLNGHRYDYLVLSLEFAKKKSLN